MGASLTDMGRNVTAGWTVGWGDGYIPTVKTTGAAKTTTYNAGQKNPAAATLAIQPYDVTIDASRVWGAEHAGEEFAPTHIRLPVILYLGIHA